MDIKSLLTEREWEFLQARRDNDEEKLAEFGDDADLLSRSIEAKVAAETNPDLSADSNKTVKEILEEDQLTQSAGIPADQHTLDLRVGDRVYYKATCAIYRVSGINRGDCGKIESVTLSSGSGRAKITAPRSMVSRVVRKKKRGRMRTSPEFRPRGVFRFDRD
jgi:hypothetical protein